MDVIFKTVGDLIYRSAQKHRFYFKLGHQLSLDDSYCTAFQTFWHAHIIRHIQLLLQFKKQRFSNFGFKVTEFQTTPSCSAPNAQVIHMHDRTNCFRSPLMLNFCLSLSRRLQMPIQKQQQLTISTLLNISVIF